MTVRSATMTVAAAGSIAVTGSPVSSMMSWSAYHSPGLMTISSTVFSPASTEDNRMRL